MPLSDHDRTVLARLEQDLASASGSQRDGARECPGRARALARASAGALAVVLIVIGLGNGVVGIALAATGYLLAVAALTSAAAAVHRRRSTPGAVPRKYSMTLLRRYAPGPDGAR